MPVANYLEFGSELKIKVDLAFPLNASEEDVKAVETTSQVDEVLKGLCHGFKQIFEQPKFIFVSKETKK